MFGSEGFGLLALRDGPRTRVIVATATGAGDGALGGLCCLSISTVSVGDVGISVHLIERTFGSAEGLQIADLEGDGTDEMITNHTASDGSAFVVEYALLRQVGDGFDRETLVLEGDEALYFAGAGDSDGVPGDDLLFTEENTARLIRVVDDHGLLRVETASSDAFSSRRMQGWPAGTANGLIAWVHERGLSTVRWPRDEEPEVLAEVTTPTFPSVFQLGAGRSARWVEFGGLGPGGGEDLATRIYDSDQNLERVIEAPALARQLFAVTSRGPLSAMVPERYLWEHIGPIPGGLGVDRPAVIGHGSLLDLGPDGSIRVEPAAHLVGVGVIGIAGADDGWLAVAGEWWGSGTSTYLGNVGYEPAFGMLGVIPLTELLDTSAGRAPAVEISGATVIGSGADERLFTSDDEFQLTVRGQPGDFVVAYDQRRSVAEEVTGDSVTLTIDPPGRDDRNREFELSVFVIGPTGLTSGASWQAEALRVAPEVTASAEVDVLALQATISGRVTSGVTLTVDGASVVPSPSGAFRVEVDAPIWPRDVVVVARDPIGNEAVEHLEIVGFVDYRGLPWIPIVGVATILAGILLFVRTPSLRPESRPLPDGDGRLEEIDGDLV
jgi:hypothetical protein